jgi:hypothetical protein
MSESDYCRANLEVCWRMAEKTPNELEKRAWLDMAESWRLLIAVGDRPSTGEDSVAVRPSPSSGDRIMQVGSVICWVRRQLPYLSVYRAMVREKAANFLDLLFDSNDHQREPRLRAAPRRRFGPRFPGNKLADVARPTPTRRRAW